MKAILPLGLAAALIAGCAQSKTCTAKPGGDKTVKTSAGEMTRTANSGTPKLGSVDAEGFTLISDGSWTGWRVNENAKAWSIVNGAFRAQGDRSHNFYNGPLAPFKDFELKVDVMTEPGSTAASTSTPSTWIPVGRGAATRRRSTRPRAIGANPAASTRCRT